MKWSYTNGKLNVSSDKTDQQYLLKELVEEASRHQAYRKKLLSLFIILSLVLLLVSFAPAPCAGRPHPPRALQSAQAASLSCAVP